MRQKHEELYLEIDLAQNFIF